MSSAYAFAEGDAPIPDEVVLARNVEHYGAQAVFGRPLSFHEIRMMTMAENVVNAHQARRKSENWAEWAEKNPTLAELLGHAGRLYEELDNG